MAGNGVERCSLVLGDNTICDKPQGHEGTHGTDLIIWCHTCGSTLLYKRESGKLVVYHTCNPINEQAKTRNEKPTNPSHGEPDARIAEIQERESKATKGPWSTSPSDEGNIFSHIDSEDWTAFARVVTRMEGDEQECRENADFIAHARADIPFLLEQLTELRSLILGKMGEGEKLAVELEQARKGQKHTQDWYASHYGKLEDWARKRLPENWQHEFFSCVANGTWGHADVGPRYICKAGFEVEPSGYIKFSTAQEQILHDQSTRAENAELRAERAEARLAAQPDVRELLKTLRQDLGDIECASHEQARKVNAGLDKFEKAISAHLAPQAGVPNKIGECGEAAQMGAKQAGASPAERPTKNSDGAEQHRQTVANGLTLPPLSNEHSPIPSASHTPRCPKGQIAKDEICGEIQDIMAVYREQDASSYGVDTPRGLEHMGDVWKLLGEWDRKLSTRARECEFCYDILPSHKSNCRLANENAGLATAILTELGDALGLNLEMHSERVLAIIRERKPLAQFFPVTSSQGGAEKEKSE